jgi:hypothetical protein
MARRFGTRRALLESQAVWTPRQLSGLTAWYDSQEITTLFQNSALTTPAGNGDVIGGWVDKSGNGYAVTQGTTANKPTMTVNSINGIAAPVFDGGDYLTNGPLGALFSGSDVPFTVAAVFKQNSVAASQYMWAFGNSGNDLPFHASRLYQTGSLKYMSYRSDNTGATATPSGGTNDISPHVGYLVFTGTTVSIVIDGTAVVSGAASDVGALTVNQFAMGGLLRTSFSLGFNGPIGELVVINRAITSVEAGQLNRYMGSQWGISVS